MAFLTCTDMDDTFEVVIFPTLYKKVEPWLTQHTIFIIKGANDSGSQSLKIKAQDLLPLDLVRTQGFGITEMRATLPHPFDTTILSQLQALIIPGQTIFTLCFIRQQKMVQLTTKTKITVTQGLMEFAQQHHITINLEW